MIPPEHSAPQGVSSPRQDRPNTPNDFSQYDEWQAEPLPIWLHWALAIALGYILCSVAGNGC